MKEVYCSNDGCGKWVIPSENWLCPCCEALTRYAAWMHPCESCGALTQWLRSHWRTQHFCPCSGGPEAIAAAQRHQESLDRQRVREAEAERLAESRRRVNEALAEQEQDRVKAAACLDHKGGVCRVSRRDLNYPKPYCYRCENVADKRPATTSRNSFKEVHRAT